MTENQPGGSRVKERTREGYEAEQMDNFEVL